MPEPISFVFEADGEERVARAFADLEQRLKRLEQAERGAGLAERQQPAAQVGTGDHRGTSVPNTMASGAPALTGLPGFATNPAT